MVSCLLVALVVNGEIDDPAWMSEELARYEQVIAVDGGLNHCHDIGVVPQLIVGDLDSVTPERLSEYADVPLIKLERAKDKTDLEAALDSIDFAAVEKVTIFAGLGKRTDQMLGHFFLLARYPGQLFLETPTEVIFAITPKNGNLDIPSTKGQTISLIPFDGASKGIVTAGLRWELHDGVLDRHFIGISNVCLQDRFSVRVGEGCLLVIINKNLIDLDMVSN